MKETTAITEEEKFEWPPKNAHCKQRGMHMKSVSVRLITFGCTVTILETVHDKSHRYDWNNQSYILYVMIGPLNNPWIFHVFTGFGEAPVSVSICGNESFMKCKDWNKSESDSWLIYQSGSMRSWGTGKLIGRSGIHGCFSLHFRSQFFQCSVCYIALLFFQSISEIHNSIAFWYLLVNPTSTVAKQQVFLENLNASTTLPWLWVLRGPLFSLVSERGLFSWIVHTGSGGMEFQVTLCSAAPRFLSQLTSWHVCSCSVAERQSPCAGSELPFFTFDPGHGVGRIPECSCPAGFTS